MKTATQVNLTLGTDFKQLQQRQQQPFDLELVLHGEKKT